MGEFKNLVIHIDVVVSSDTHTANLLLLARPPASQ